MVWGCIAIILLFTGLKTSNDAVMLTAAILALASTNIISKCYINSSKKGTEKNEKH